MSATKSALKKSLRAAEQDRPDVAAARAELAAEQPKLKPQRLFFIDETSVNTKMTRFYGRALVGRRLVAKVPHGHWKTLTLVAALCVRGLIAPCVIVLEARLRHDGAMDGQAFLAYIEQIVAPMLSRGDIVFMDNSSTHKSDDVRAAIEARWQQNFVSRRPILPISIRSNRPIRN